MKIKSILVLLVILALPLLYSCADKFNIDQFNNSDNNGNVNIGGDTVYVHLKPDWEGFNHPQAMIVGREPFIYVADTDNNRIVMLNLNGDVLGYRSVKQPVAIAQDYELNLIVCAQLDTTVGGKTQTFGAVFKYDMVAASHHISEAPVKMLLPRATDFSNPSRQYTGVAAFYNNSFYVARTGVNNSSVVNPDNSILYFSPKKYFGGGVGDTLIGRVPNIDPLSSGLVSADQISSLTSFNQKNIDFILTLTGNNSLKTQWLTYVVTPVSADYYSKYKPSDGVALMQPNKFGKPEGTAIDNSGSIFVADALKDSVFKFNAFGEESQSFGGPSIFKEPYSVAFFDKTLYVVDRGSNKILRFILSTDL